MSITPPYADGRHRESGTMMASSSDVRSAPPDYGRRARGWHAREHPDAPGHGDPGAHEHPHRPYRHGATTSVARLTVVLALTATFMIAEAVGGILTGSLALLADAGHMLTDALALAISLLAAWYVRQPAHPRHTFGPARIEVLAALVNGLLVLGVSGLVMVEAIRRVSEPPEIQSAGMLAIAAAGLLVNLLGLAILQHAGESLNVRGAVLHVAGDAVGSLGALVAGGLILVFHWTIADALASMLISVLIAVSAVGLVRSTMDILMEAVPHRIDIGDVRRSLLGVPGVREVHDLHVWQLNTGYTALSAHVVVSEDEHSHRCDPCIAALRHQLRKEFDIHHTTLQVETADQQETLVCDDACDTRS